MFEADNIRGWRDHDVSWIRTATRSASRRRSTWTRLRCPGVRLGQDRDHRTAAADLRAGGPGRRGALVRAYSKKQVKDAFEIDADGELAGEEEPGLFEHYGLAHQSGASGERRLARR